MTTKGWCCSRGVHYYKKVFTIINHFRCCQHFEHVHRAKASSIEKVYKNDIVFQKFNMINIILRLHFKNINCLYGKCGTIYFNNKYPWSKLSQNRVTFTHDYHQIYTFKMEVPVIFRSFNLTLTANKMIIKINSEERFRGLFHFKLKWRTTPSST